MAHRALHSFPTRRSSDLRKKSIFVYETGEAHRLDEKGVREGIEGTLRVMKHLGMKSNIPEVKRETEFYYKSAWVRARHAGLFQPSVVLAAPLTRLQALARIP